MLHVQRVSPVATMETRSGGPFHRQLAQGTVQQWGLANGATGPLRAAIAVHADGVQRHHVHASSARLLRRHRQILEHLGPSHQQTPPVQEIGIATLQVVVEHAMLLGQEHGLSAGGCGLGQTQGRAKVIQRIRPRVAAELLQLIRQMQALQFGVESGVQGQDRVVGRATGLQVVVCVVDRGIILALEQGTGVGIELISPLGE